MSKGNNYQKYYNRHKNEEAVNEPIVKPQTEEVHAAEETAEVPQEERHCEASAEEQKMEEFKPKTATVIGAKRVNMRCDASKDAPVLTVLSEGKEVRIVEKSSDGVWSRIQCNGKYGFMMSQFLKEI